MVGRIGSGMITTVSSFHLNLDPALYASLGAIAVLILIALLALKELVSTLEGRWQTLARYLNVPIVPLLVTFCVTVGIKISDALKK
jgi:hypothetical protein